MTVFLTGSSGHLGANTARLLVDSGCKVRVLVRPHAHYRALKGLDVERVEGDLEDADKLADALNGCDQVIHLAAMVSMRRCDQKAMFISNVDGTQNLLRACERAGVRRMVHCSSLGTLGHHRGGQTDEETGPPQTASFYDYTKLCAEAAVMHAAARGLDVSIVNPSALIGPHDYKPSLIGQTLIDFARGRLLMYVHGGYDFVSVIDAAKGCILALERGQKGRRYILCGEHVEVKTILGWWSEWLKRPVPRWSMSPHWVLPFARVKDQIDPWLFPRHHPKFNGTSIELLAHPKYPSNARARRELGWNPSPVQAAFYDHVTFFRQLGQLPNSSAT